MKNLIRSFIISNTVIFAVTFAHTHQVSAQIQPIQNANQYGNVHSIRETLEVAESENGLHVLNDTREWWDDSATSFIGLDLHPVSVDAMTLVEMALLHSSQIKVYQDIPRIRSTAKAEAVAAFDWVRFGETMWNDSSDPVGSSLTVGGPASRYLNQQWTGGVGLRRKNTRGGRFDVRQDVGWQDTNSNYFIPDNQGTARLSIGYTQPLMKGRGQTYNQSMIVLASIDTEASQHELRRQLQSHVNEVVRGYWALYLERASLAQKVALFNKTQSIVDRLQARSNIDVAQSQLASVTAAHETRRSDLVRAKAAVENAETRLRALINSPQLEGAIELVPHQLPTLLPYETNTLTEVEKAIANRPEVHLALKEIKAACVRLEMAKHEMKPMLDLVTRTYVAGLQGDSQIFDAWSDQFSTGRPSYAAGLQYEVPVGRRAAKATLSRRQLEMGQLQEKYRAALENIKAEVEVAVRELETSYSEALARHRSLASLVKEQETLEARWIHDSEPGTGSLNLQALLHSQEKLAQGEFDYAKALLTYNLSLVNLQLVNGTLLQTETLDYEDVQILAESTTTDRSISHQTND